MMFDEEFSIDVINLKNKLLIVGGKLSDEIDELVRNTEQHAAYFGYLKDFLINSGCLCDDIIQAAQNDAILLALIGTRVLLEDTINVHYVEAKTNQADRMAVATNWLKISNDPHAHKSDLDGNNVMQRAKIAGKDIKALYYGEYAMFCNYTHSSAHRGILNIPDHRALGAKKAELTSLMTYANIVSCIARIIGSAVPQPVFGATTNFLAKYRVTVSEATLPID
jgi:hypothetical protein